MTAIWTRRSLLAGAAALGPALIVRPARAADYKFAQYHNQSARGTLHKNLTAMWEAIRAQSSGRRAADYKFAQYHNQSAGGTLHKNLTAMWEAIRAESSGRIEATVHAENNKLKGGDPEALKLLIAGEIQFFTLMGGIIGTVVPVAEVQQVPFAFKAAAEAHKAIDGALGKYVGDEMAAKGMHLFPVAGFDNGIDRK